MERVSDLASEQALGRSERDFRRNIGAALTTGVIALVMLAAAATWLYLRDRAYSGWVDHTYVAQVKLGRLATLVEQIETARRGYLLSPRPNIWESYLRARTDLPRRLDDFAAFTSDNPSQRARVAALRPLEELKLAHMRDTVELAHAGDLQGARRNFIAQQDQQITERMRIALAAIGAEEQRLLDARVARQKRSTSALLGVILATIALLAAIAAGAFLLVRRYSSKLERAQGTLRRLNGGLEDAVRERTRELTRANEELQRFAYIVSHDLRAPLVNIMGFTSELEAATPPLKRLIEAAEKVGVVTKEARFTVEEELPEAIDFIRKSSQKMDRLINAILKLSREGRRVLAADALDMQAVVGAIASTLHQLCETRGVELIVEPGLPSLTGDRVAVEQIFSNLMENAVKYTKPGTAGRVVVRGWLSSGRAVYEVQDNGRGIDPKDHERIFDLFRRSGSQDQPGEGIGLAHVRALVYRMGGMISCVSELGQGAVFRVSLPRHPAREEDAA